MQVGENDTIAALATARGRAALAVVRVSGPRAIAIADACFQGRRLADADSHTAHVGFIQGADGSEIDQVVTTIFRAPASSTGEDVVEVTCHGGDFAAQFILDRLHTAGARPARPGEFTQRAFLNGKVDLAQAEAVADLIHSSSSMAHRVSLHHLKGRYSELIKGVRGQLLEVAALTELQLDFSEEDVEFADSERLLTLVDEARLLLRRLLESYRLGVLLRDGVRVVIGGRPNAGKSTLLNAILGHDRAIVNEEPGTTRDEIEAEAELGGVRFRFVDTAGLRRTENVIEAEGVRRAEESLAAADAVVYVYDLRHDLDEDEVQRLRVLKTARPDLPVIVVGNKRDLAEDARRVDLNVPGTTISARSALGDERELAGLLSLLHEAVGEGLLSGDASAVVMNQRHRTHLQAALDALDSVQNALHDRVYADAVAIDLRFALHELGAITGEVTNEDVLDQIFSRFCIGK